MTDLFVKLYNKEKMMSKNPTLIGCVAGIKFYEHPDYGDEYPLVAVKDDECGLTDFCELPELEELGEWQ